MSPAMCVSASCGSVMRLHCLPLSSQDGDFLQPHDAGSPTRTEDVLLWLQAADPPHSAWQKQSCVCTAEGRLNVGGFRLRKTIKERETVHRQKTCCKWLFIYLVFLLCLNVVPKNWEFSVTDDQRQTCLAHRVSAQGQ